MLYLLGFGRLLSNGQPKYIDEEINPDRQSMDILGAEIGLARGSKTR